MPIEGLHIVGWAAYLSAAATVVTFVTGVLFFTVGQPFGTIQDASSALQVLLMPPIALVLYFLSRPHAPALSLLATVVGIAGMLVAGTFQVLLVFRAVQFAPTIRPTLTAGGAIGVWLVMVGAIGIASGTLPSGLAWWGIVAGGGYILLVIGFWLGGQQHPLFWTGSLAAVIGYAVWAFSLGHALLSGTLVAAR
jgi:hypothetical protein